MNATMSTPTPKTRRNLRARLCRLAMQGCRPVGQISVEVHPYFATRDPMARTLRQDGWEVWAVDLTYYETRDGKCYRYGYVSAYTQDDPYSPDADWWLGTFSPAV